MKAPLVVSYGAGVDSTAMLVAMWLTGERPDAILFADVGSEKASTYGYLITMQAWCESVGFPSIQIVRHIAPKAGDVSLFEECIRKSMLPSRAFGMSSCSLKWKAEPQERWLRVWGPAIACWNEGAPIRRAIGFDDSGADRKRADRVRVAIGLDDSAADQKRGCSRYAKTPDSKRFAYEYPLQLWHLDREDCKELIRFAGLPVPDKSSCTFCPSMKKWEIESLVETDPAAMLQALMMESRFLNGKHYRGENGSCHGLGRRFTWASVLGATMTEED